MSTEQTEQTIQINKYLQKTIIKDGVGNQPQNLQDVLFHYILKDENNNFICGSDLNHLSVTIGQKQTQWYIEETLKSMKIGERCLATIQNPKFFEPEGTEIPEEFIFENFENNKKLELEIEIIRFGQLKNNNWDLTSEQRLEKGSLLKTEGNGFIKAQQFQQAKDSYEEALKIVKSDSCQDLKNGLLNNLALAQLKLKDYQSCIEICKEALEHQVRNVKIIYRLGVAQMGNSDFEDAIKTFQSGLQIDESSAELKKELEICKQKQKQAIKKQQQQFGKIFQ